MKTYFAKLLLMSLFAGSAFAHNFSLSTNVKNLNILNAISDVQNELPETLKANINKNIKITFKNLNNSPVSSIDDSCQAKIIIGQDNLLTLNNNEILIDNVFLTEMENPNRTINCAHKSIAKYFKATIVHELAHIFDQNNKISNQPEFLNIAGWISKGFFIHKRANLNQNIDRSVDRYEFKNHLESFAVNFEHYLYDSEFKCRKPTFYQYFVRLLKQDTFENIDCHVNSKIVMTPQTFSASKTSSLIKNLDLNRLYQVHYLFAGKGTQPMSRFGHAMFRLVFCAPNKQVGPSCLTDTAYHIVLSFRANIQDLQMDYSKGINGKYPSQLFFLTLPDVVDEYTKGEFREVTSIPLNLSPAQLNLFLQRTLEIFWSYKGKYYFFTNNCATEALNLLRIAMPENNKVQKVDVTTPIGLYNFLIKENIADASMLNDLVAAELKGYYFPGVDKKIKKSLQILKINETDFHDFLEKNNASKRMELYQNAIDSSENQTVIAANALRVEDLIMRSLEIKFTKEIGAKIFGTDPDPRLVNTELGDKIKEMQKLYAEISPENFLAPGYGIPLENEFLEIPEETILRISTQIKSYTQEMQSVTQEFFPEQVKELTQTMSNRYSIMKYLK